MELLSFLKERYSVRMFKDEMIKQEDLDLILEAGRVSPTAKNLQPQKIYVCRSESALNKLNSLTKCIYGAKTVLVICYDKEVVWKNKRRDGYNTGEVDATIVATHMMLEAYSIGVGSCLVGMFSDEEVKDALNLDSNDQVVLLMPIGYIADESTPNEEYHSQKKPICDTVKYL